MDPFYILAVLTSTLIFIILPLFFIGFIYFVLKRKSSKKIASIVCFTLLTTFGYLISANFFPRETFYAKNFEDNTKIALPKSAKLINHLGNNSIYNLGDYSISYIYELSPMDFQKLYYQVIEKGFKTSDHYLETVENEELINTFSHTKINRILTKEFGYKQFDILFLKDNKTVIFNSNKW